MYQLRKFARRNRALVGGLALAGAILLIGAAVSLAFALRATAAERLAESRRSEAVASSQLAERRRAVADSALRVADSARAEAQREGAAATASAKRAADEAAKAQAVNAFLQQMLASSDPANARGKELSVRELLDKGGTDMNGAAFAGQPEVKAAVESTIGRTYFGLGLYDQARPHLDSAYAIRRRTLGAGNLSTAVSADELGKLAHAAGDALADRSLTEALATMRATLKPDDDRITSALSALGDVRQQQGKFPEAEALYRESLKLTRQRHGNEAVQTATRLQALGTFLAYTARAPEGLPLLEQAVAILRRVYGANHPAVVNGLIGLSDAQGGKPDYAAAEKTLREALPIARALYGQQHPNIANILSRLGTVLVYQRRLEEAEPLAREALAMRIALLGEQHPDVQLQRTELARLLQTQGRYDQADTLYRQALAGRRAALGDSSPAVAATLGDLGILAKLREDWPRAEKLFREAAPIWQAAKIEDQDLWTLGQLGWAIQKQDRFAEADTMLRQVLARRRALFGDEHWSVGDTYEKLSAVALGRGKPAQAESLAMLGLGIRQKAYGPRSPQVAYQLVNVASSERNPGDTSAAIATYREALSLLASRPPSDLNVISYRRLLAVDLCATGAVAEGDSLIRAVIEQVPLDTTKALPYRARSALGFCLIREKRFAEAEPLLLEAEARLGALPGSGPSHDVVVRWLVNLYDAWGNTEKAALGRD